MARVVLAMSGGVDSSVAAHLLLQQGHELIGVFMRHGVQSPAAACAVGEPPPLLPIASARTDHKQGCCSAADAADARRVADRLEIPFYALDLQEEFRADYRLFCGRVHHRPDAEPLRHVQQLAEVRQAV